MLGTATRCHSELKTGNVKAKNCNGKKGAEAAKRLESFSLTEKQIIFPHACPVFFYYRYKCICCRYIYKMYSQIYMNFSCVWNWKLSAVFVAFRFWKISIQAK